MRFTQQRSGILKFFFSEVNRITKKEYFDSEIIELWNTIICEPIPNMLEILDKVLKLGYVNDIQEELWINLIEVFSKTINIINKEKGQTRERNAKLALKQLVLSFNLKNIAC